MMSLYICLLSHGQPREYTFDECVAMALHENARVRAGQNNIIGARLQKKEAITNYLPALSLGANGIAANDYMINTTMAFPPQMQIPSKDIELIKNGITANATAMLPIFTGGQIYNGNRLAKLGIAVEELKLRQTENEIRNTVAQYYWHIVLLKDKLKTVDAIKAQLEVIYGDAEAAYNAGITTRNDLLQVNLKKNEIESISIELNNNIDVLRMFLAQYVGLKDYNLLIIPEFNSSISVVTPESLLVNPENAILSTPEYQLLDKNIEAARIQKRIKLGESLPKVAVGGGFFYNNLLDKSKNLWIGMVTVSIPINWKTGYSMRRSKLNIENAAMEMSDGSERLTIAIHKAYNDLTVAFKNIDIARRSIEQANENLRMHEDFYQAGTVTMADLLDAQTLYRQGCDRYSEAVSTYEIKKVEYLVMTGR